MSGNLNRIFCWRLLGLELISTRNYNYSPFSNLTEWNVLKWAEIFPYPFSYRDRHEVKILHQSRINFTVFQDCLPPQLCFVSLSRTQSNTASPVLLVRDLAAICTVPEWSMTHTYEIYVIHEMFQSCFHSLVYEVKSCVSKEGCSVNWVLCREAPLQRNLDPQIWMLTKPGNLAIHSRQCSAP